MEILLIGSCMAGFGTPPVFYMVLLCHLQVLMNPLRGII